MIEVTDEMVAAAEMVHRLEGTTREALEAALSAAPPITVTDAMVEAALAEAMCDRAGMRRALTAALSAAPDPWRPIETAPKDGPPTWVLLSDGVRVRVGSWSELEAGIKIVANGNGIVQETRPLPAPPKEVDDG